MIREGSNAMAILYEFIQNTPLKAALSGDVYLDERPLGSSLEDLVLNPLPFRTDQIQFGTLNANLYVPEIAVKIGTVEQKKTDWARINVLVDLAKALFGDVVADDYQFGLANVGYPKEPETNQTYANLRIDFKFFPTD